MGRRATAVVAWGGVLSYFGHLWGDGNRVVGRRLRASLGSGAAVLVVTSALVDSADGLRDAWGEAITVETTGERLIARLRR